MTAPLMPKATAAWLIRNTTLTFEQISDFCNMHTLEIQSIADGEAGSQVIEENPIVNGELTKEEISRCEQDPNAKLQIIEHKQSVSKTSKKQNARYTPIARRQDKPDAIMWLIKNYPDIKDNQIVKLLGTTKNTIYAVKHKEHWNTSNIRPRDPVLLGLCSQVELNKVTNSIKPAENKDEKSEDITE